MPQKAKPATSCRLAADSGAVPAPPKSAAAGRARLIKVLHVARRELERAGQLDEPGYREILRAASHGRHDSSAAMSYTDLKAALERLQRAGFQVRRRPAAATRPLEVNPEASKVRALWLFLHHELGMVVDPSERALAAYVKRIVRVDDLRFALGRRTSIVIETLKKWAMRRLPAVVDEMKQELLAHAAAQPLTPEQIDCANKAQMHLGSGEGFDKYWMAWECLMHALDRPIVADLAGIAHLPAPASPQERKVWALWHQLHRDGVVRDPSARALSAFVKRQTGQDLLSSLNGAQLSTVIDALDDWRVREVVLRRVAQAAAEQ